MKEALIEILKQLAAIFTKEATLNALPEANVVEIKCSSLTDKYVQSVSIYNHPELEAFFDDIKKENSVVYWFRIISNHKAEEIFKLGEAFIENKGSINAFGMKDKIADPESKILYIGKTQTNFKGRLVAHFGYNKNKKYAGLQLYHWSPKDLVLSLEYIPLPKNYSELAGYLELNLARKYKPILGKHRS